MRKTSEVDTQFPDILNWTHLLISIIVWQPSSLDSYQLSFAQNAQNIF